MRTALVNSEIDGPSRVIRWRVRHAAIRRGVICAVSVAALCLAAMDIAGLSGDVALTGAARADEPAKQEKKKPRPTVDAAAVYFGNASNFHKPAEVDTNRVWAEIPEYKKLLEDELEPGSAAYELLLEKASRRFTSAVRKAARAGGYDLVARSGSVKNVTDVPDLTQSVIDRL